jgi:3-hydroxyacyl-CoA dehydrogenase/enoyl-CoA hydratase/3-hydroxybutyryl-CoA epimerase
MELMLTGKPVTVDKARRIGLVDRVADEDSWRDVARELISAKPPKNKPPFMERFLNLLFVRPFIKPTLIGQVAAKARKDHYPAPYAMIDLWAKHGASPDTGYEAEARSFADLMCTDTSRNLVRVFFLQTKLKGQGNKDKSKIEHVHVIGAGVMGGDIAAYCALRGINVTLQDREEKYIQPAIERAHKMYAKRIRDESDREAAIKRLQSDVEGAGVAQADLIIEAIFENLEAPSASIAEAIVFAVYIPPQAPAPGQACRTISERSVSSILSAMNSP